VPQFLIVFAGWAAGRASR